MTTDENLEQNPNPEEPTGEASDEEITEPVSGEEEEVSGEEKVEPIPTFTEGDIAKKREEWEREWQSRKDKEFSEYQTKIRDLERQARTAELAAKEKGELDRWLEAGGDETQIKEFQTERRRFLEEQSKFVAEQEENRALATQLNEQAKAIAVHRLSGEYGVEEKELLDAKTPGEMEMIAVKLAYQKNKEELDKKAKEKLSQKIDSGTPSATGVDLDKLSARQLIQKALDEKK